MNRSRKFFRSWIRRLGRIDRDVLFDWVARFGHGARGAVYIALGGLCLLAALHLRPSAEGTGGAIQAIADWPLGPLWLSVIAAGLFGFAAWRLVQAVFDPDGNGTDAKGVATRLGEAASGVTYGALGWTALSLLDGLEDYNESDEEARQTAAWILGLPYGQELLLAAGAAVCVAGLVYAGRGLFTNVCRRLRCSSRIARRALIAGRIGYVARGVGFLLLGALLLRAGWTTDPGHAASLEGALDALARQASGRWLLGATSAGFIAFGLFGLFEARYRRISVPDELSES